MEIRSLFLQRVIKQFITVILINNQVKNSSHEHPLPDAEEEIVHLLFHVQSKRFYLKNLQKEFGKKD